jgi:multidrug efflux system outer membrane protein
MKSRLQTLATLALLLLTLPACTLGPDYHRPVMETPAGFKAEGSWQESAPRDEQSRGLWWTVFNDPALNELEQKASTGNLEVQAAVARLDQARALLGVSRADRLPRLDFNPSATRGRTSAFGVSAVGNDLRLPLDLGYEIDLWGRVRRSVEAASADADGSLAALESIRLTLQGEVARNYFALRTVDAQSALLQRTIELRRQSLNLVTSLFDNGQIGELDVARARAELAATEAEQAGLQGSRSALENALAVLAGENPSVFRLAAAPLDLRAPAVAPGLPASLLERRPDASASPKPPFSRRSASPAPPAMPATKRPTSSTGTAAPGDWGRASPSPSSPADAIGPICSAARRSTKKRWPTIASRCWSPSVTSRTPSPP